MWDIHVMRYLLDRWHYDITHLSWLHIWQCIQNDKRPRYERVSPIYSLVSSIQYKKSASVWSWYYIFRTPLTCIQDVRYKRPQYERVSLIQDVRYKRPRYEHVSLIYRSISTIQYKRPALIWSWYSIFRTLPTPRVHVGGQKLCLCLYNIVKNLNPA